VMTPNLDSEPPPHWAVERFGKLSTRLLPAQHPRRRSLSLVDRAIVKNHRESPAPGSAAQTFRDDDWTFRSMIGNTGTPQT